MRERERERERERDGGRENFEQRWLFFFKLRQSRDGVDVSNSGPADFLESRWPTSELEPDRSKNEKMKKKSVHLRGSLRSRASRISIFNHC